ncbi:MAG TPA: hypothetical protein VL989_01180 [Candidatus Sulfotelmatobacter sp.]|nr:hypothetical protein [Candidatus Sulfotelmatobacter sp.]
MDRKLVDELKRFIALAVSEQTSDLRLDLRNLEDRIDAKIDNLSSYIADALDRMNDSFDRQFKNHEKRIVKLEKKAF